MKVRTKLLIVVLAVAAIFAGAVLAYTAIERYRAVALFDNEKIEKNRTFDEILGLEQSTLRLYSVDYTYWDQMVNLIERNDDEDKKWAKENIDSSLITYRADAVWVFANKPEMVYSAFDLKKADLVEAFPVPIGAIKTLFGPGEHFCHFFVKTSNGILEVRGATVHPGWDEKRTSPGRGYFFTARLLDPEYVSQLSDYLGGVTVEIAYSFSGGENMKEDLRKGIIRFYRTLKSWDGTVACYFKVAMKSTVLENFRKFSRHMYVMLFLFAFATAGTLLFFLSWWIDRPIRRISRSLERDTADEIRPLLGKWDEFGRMAQLIDNFFRQRNALVAEIDRRKKIEEELSVKLSQLKQFKDIAVGREIKMIDLKKEINKLSKELGRPEPYDASF